MNFATSRCDYVTIHEKVDQYSQPSSFLDDVKDKETLNIFGRSIYDLLMNPFGKSSSSGLHFFPRLDPIEGMFCGFIKIIVLAYYIEGFVQKSC